MDAPAYATRFQRQILWQLSQGNTVRGTAESMGTARQSVVDSLTLLRRKFGATTNVQLVLRAYTAGVIGVHEDCGTRSSFVRHTTSGEDACPACRSANAQWVAAQEGPRPVLRPLTEAQIRIIRAYDTGWSQAEIQRKWNVSRSQLHRAVADMYRRLGVQDVPRDIRRERALAEARRRGYLRPEAPSVGRSTAPDKPVGLTPRELEILSALPEGRPLSEASRILGLPREQISSRLTWVYRKLGVSHLPRSEKRPAALKAARDLGYLV